MLQNLSSAAVVIGAIRVKCWLHQILSQGKSRKSYLVPDQPVREPNNAETEKS